MIELVIVSRLLEYPDAALWQHQQEMFEAIAASKNLPKEDAHALGIFLRDLTTMDPLDAQAQYSELFDRGRFERYRADSGIAERASATA